LAAEVSTETEGTLTSRDGTKLAYRAWGVASKPDITFAVVHGLGDHAGRYQRFAAGMAKHGMATYAVDLRSHGKSPGQRGHIDSFDQWTDDCAALVNFVRKETGGSEVIPLGHSFGGVTLLGTVLAGKIPEAKRFIVSSAALKVKVAVPPWKISVGKAASKITPRLALDNEVNVASLSRIQSVVDDYRKDPLVHRKISSRLYTEYLGAVQFIMQNASKIKVPFLILAGADDALIDPEGSRQLHSATTSGSTLEILPGRFHEPFNDIDSEEVFALIARWLNKKS
jgi:alpha-beta hydrolase superfamily lysophospholipase